MRENHGFTLIETLVGLTIIAVLVVGAYTLWQRPVDDEPTTTPTTMPPITATEAPTSVPTQTAKTTEPPTLPPTATNPRLHTNDIANFKLEFPLNWQVPASVYSNQVTPSGDGPGPGWGFQTSKENSNLPILLVQNLGRIDKSNLAQNAEGVCSWVLEPAETLNVVETRIDGHHAKFYENIKFNEDLNKEAYYACIYVTGNPGFNIVWHDATRNKSPDLNQILSTFQFTN